MIEEPAIDTIVALSSGRPPAAIAVIRTSGPRATDVCQAIAGRLPAPRKASLARLRDPTSGDILDDALVLFFPAPNSSTGEDIVEYQCHGGRAVVGRLHDVIAAQPGLRAAEPGEFTRRALMNGRIDLTEAEGLADLLEAETESQRKAALLMAEGGLSTQVEQWRERLVALSARAEAAIDYVDDEDETASDASILAREGRALRAEIEEWLARPRAEPLRDGIRVVLAGPPNAGKSSLINALVGSERAIVTDIAGTTRDFIEVPVAVGGVPFVLVDTAGLRKTEDQVERAGIARSLAESDRSDILLWLGEGEPPPHRCVLRLHPQCDRPDREVAPKGTIAVSALVGTNLKVLWDRLVEEAAKLLPSEGTLALNRRQAAVLEEVVDRLGVLDVHDIVLTAHAFRAASDYLDRLTGRSGIEDMLDALFGRFCLGK